MGAVEGMSEKQIAHFEWLKLCGCGEPVDAYNFCRAALALFDRRGEGQWKNAERELIVLIQSRPEVAAHVFAHLLSGLDLLEHGGSVGGAWLIGNGIRIVDMGPMQESDLGLL